MDRASGKHIWLGRSCGHPEAAGEGSRAPSPLLPRCLKVSVPSLGRIPGLSPKGRRKCGGAVTHWRGQECCGLNSTGLQDPLRPRAPPAAAPAPRPVTLAAPTCQVAGGDPGSPLPAGCPPPGRPVPPRSGGCGAGGHLTLAGSWRLGSERRSSPAHPFRPPALSLLPLPPLTKKRKLCVCGGPCGNRRRANARGSGERPASADTADGHP